MLTLLKMPLGAANAKTVPSVGSARGPDFGAKLGPVPLTHRAAHRQRLAAEASAKTDGGGIVPEEPNRPAKHIITQAERLRFMMSGLSPPEQEAATARAARAHGPRVPDAEAALVAEEARLQVLTLIEEREGALQVRRMGFEPTRPQPCKPEPSPQSMWDSYRRGHTPAKLSRPRSL